MRRIGERFRRGVIYRRRPGAYGIVAGEGGLLLVDENGELQLPGGGIDPGEGPMQALHRELREETGWRIADLRHFGAFQRFVYMPDYGFWGHKIQAIFLARAVRQLGPPLEAACQPVWMAPEQAARHLDVEGDRVMVARALARGLI